MTIDHRPSEIRSLIQPEKGLVDRRLFGDQEIYQLELERIYARAWNFMCHDSQIPNPGDFFMTFIGEDRVIDTVTALLELGADVNATRKGGETALHVATVRGYNQAIKLLTGKGASVNARNANGQTALGLIAGREKPTENRRGLSEDRKTTAELLRSLGATE